MIVDSLFNIINFLIFIGVGGYFFYRFIRPMIISSIQEEIEEKNAFSQEQLTLESLQKEREHQFVEEKQFYTYMLKKIGRWRVSSTRKRAFARAQEDKQELLVRSKIQKKREYLQFYKMQQKVVPCALQMAREELISYFNATEAQRSYINKILQDIKSS